MDKFKNGFFKVLGIVAAIIAVIYLFLMFTK